MTKVGAEFLAAFADPLPLEAWRALEMPVLLLGGETSPAPVRAINALLASVLPRCASVTLPGIGHMGPMTHPAEVREWLPEARRRDRDAAADARRRARPEPSARQPSSRRAFSKIFCHGLASLRSPEVQLIWTLRNTRSGCGISAVKRPSAVVTAVRPPGLPFGLAG